MRKGWQMLDRVAEQSGAEALNPHVWGAVSPSGKVLPLCLTRPTHAPQLKPATVGGSGFGSFRQSLD